MGKRWNVHRAATMPGVVNSPDAILEPLEHETPQEAGRRAIKALGWQGLGYAVDSEHAARFFIRPRKGGRAVAWGALVEDSNG